MRISYSVTLPAAAAQRERLHFQGGVCYLLRLRLLSSTTFVLLLFLVVVLQTMQTEERTDGHTDSRTDGRTDI